MGEIQFPAGSRHGIGHAESTPQLSTAPIVPTEQPSTGAWPDEAACDTVGRAVQAVDELTSRAMAAGLDDVQQAASDALSALQRLDDVMGDHFDGPVRS